MSKKKDKKFFDNAGQLLILYKTMFVDYYDKFPIVRFLGGSSTLVLGSEDSCFGFLNSIANRLRSTENVGWVFPRVLTIDSYEYIRKMEVNEWTRSTYKFLEPPREILYQSLGTMICIGAKLLFLSGVTGELVEKYDNQNLTPLARVEELEINDDNYCNPDYQRAPEYPEFDEFGDPMQISWLREYALRAEDFSRTHNADLFLNLEWNKSKKGFPRPFWLLFDRIYEIENTKNGEVKIIQIK